MPKLLLLIGILTLPFCAHAGDGRGGVSVDEVRAGLLQAFPELPVVEIRQSELSGFFEVEVRGGTVLYMDSGADFFFAGDLYYVQPGGLINATEQARANKRRQLLDTLDEKDMVVFAPAAKQLRATITVFTDIDCGYCRRMHLEVPELNRLGIAVRYLAYPRAGPGSASWDKAVAAWCADKPGVALSLAKAGKDIAMKTCANPVAEQYAMGGDFGVSGTPAVIYEDGTLQHGYLPAARLAQRLGIMGQPR